MNENLNPGQAAATPPADPKATTLAQQEERHRDNDHDAHAHADQVDVRQRDRAELDRRRARPGQLIGLAADEELVDVEIYYNKVGNFSFNVLSKREHERLKEEDKSKYSVLSVKIPKVFNEHILLLF